MTSFDKEAITKKNKELMFIIRLADAEYLICIVITWFWVQFGRNKHK